MARRDECSSCGKDCRVCFNCSYYDSSAYHECREPQAEWVRNKDEGNFCGYFRGNASKGSHLDESAETAKKQLADLFGDDGASESQNTLNLDSLFKK